MNETKTSIGCGKYIRYQVNGEDVYVLFSSRLQHIAVAEALPTAAPVSAGLMGLEFNVANIDIGSKTLKLKGDEQDKQKFKEMLQ